MGESNSGKKTQTPLPIGETRWWAKHNALEKVFGHFGKPDNGLLIDAVLTLGQMENFRRWTKEPSLKLRLHCLRKG